MPSRSRRPRQRCAAFTALAALLVASSTARAEDRAVPPAVPDPWAASVELYGFAPLRSTGDVTVRGFTADTDLSLGQLLPLLQFGFAMRGSVEHDRLGLLTDVSLIRLGAQRTLNSPGGLLSGSGQLTAFQGVYDLALRYRFGERERAVGQPGQFSLIPYAGLRLIQADLGLSAQLLNGQIQGQGSLDRTWGQLLLGSQASLFLSPRLQLFARADVGGFGLGGSEDLSGNAQLGLAYAVGDSTQLRLSWRSFGVHWNNGSLPANGFNTNQNGLEAGVRILF